MNSEDTREALLARYEHAAVRYEQVAAELERAAQHVRITARHFRNEDVPRACAHAWAAYGHTRSAHGQLDDLAIEHASRSNVV